MDFTPIIGYSYKKNQNGDLERFAFGGSITPIITITGLHFSGHAEFFTGFSWLDIIKTKTHPSQELPEQTKKYFL